MSTVKGGRGLVVAAADTAAVRAAYAVQVVTQRGLHSRGEVLQDLGTSGGNAGLHGTHKRQILYVQACVYVCVYVCACGCVCVCVCAHA